MTRRLLAVLLSVAGAAGAHEGDEPEPFMLPSMEVVGRGVDLAATATSASEGLIGQPELAARPWLRIGELIEAVPGFVATQHSGSGKANQYFLRGFNLDHGTDFAFSVDGIPVNQPTHGHGQGYADLNFLIPELIQEIAFHKGPYYADAGDFSSAGSARLRTADTLPAGLLETSAGPEGFRRLLVADSPHVGTGHVLYALDAQTRDGPWDNPENLRHLSSLVKFSRGDDRAGARYALQAYNARWDSTDQVPQRAVRAGALGRLGTVDPTSGGETGRYSASGHWWDDQHGLSSRRSLYLTRYDLDLFSNFTYFLDDPAAGDQFEQIDRRWTAGGAQSWSIEGPLLGSAATHEIGLALRHDRIGEVGLHRTFQRQRLSTVSRARVDESSLGVHYALGQDWRNGLRSSLGLRADLVRFDVAADRRENSGTESDVQLSPKLTLAWTPRRSISLYAAAGRALHSNDARGTTLTVEPASGNPARPVAPLVRSQGAELGLRTRPLPGWHSTLAAWALELDSELVFVGDAGNTEASRASRRRGVEWTNFWKLNAWLDADLDVAFTRARFTGPDPAGSEVPGAVDRVVAVGLSAAHPQGLFGALRLRHIGPRTLVEDGSRESRSTTLVNLGAGYRRERVSAGFEVLNLLDSDDHDIDYLYTSRLPGEPAAGVEDIHFHPVEPRTVRVQVGWQF